MSENSVTIATPDHATLEFELAGLGSRFGAHLVDALLVVLLLLALALGFLIAGAPLSLALRRSEESGQWAMSWSVAVLVFLVFLVFWGYFVFFECVMNGSTPGKRHFGLRVIRDDGLPIGFREAALRNLVRAADSLPPPTYVLGGFVMMFDQLGRRLGDMVAGTLVVREKFEMEAGAAAGAAWAARVEKGHSRQAVTLPGGGLSAVQLDLIEQFLARRFELAAHRRDALAWQITAPLLELRGEDKAQWQGRPDRTGQCERFLLEIVELAKAPSTTPLAQPSIASAPPLF